MKEKEFEEIICKYPELIETGLKLKGRQVNIKGKYVDLLFEDRHGQRLVVELKRGPVLRKHIGQLMDYEGHFLLEDDPTVRVMLVGNKFPNNLRLSLDHHGFEWKELSLSHLKDFLKKMNDVEFLDNFPKSSEEKRMKPTITRNHTEVNTEKRKRDSSVSIERYTFWASLLDKADKRTPLHRGIRTISKRNGIHAGAGKSGITFGYIGTAEKTWVELNINVKGNQEKTIEIYEKILREKEKIEKRYPELKIIWRPPKNLINSRMIVSYSEIGGIGNKEMWNEIQDDLVNRMLRFYEAFRYIIESL
jgi:uncharacterized protein DUF4268/endonuclease NucS-like protein